MFLNKYIVKAQRTLKQNGHTLKPHQAEALKWLTNTEKHTHPFGGILADEMGLGKTLEIISLLISRKMNKTLIIVPANLISQWRSEIAKFAPHLKVNNTLDTNPDIVITSYILASRKSQFFELIWDRIILDEAHYIRNPKGTVHQSLKKLKAKHKWCLTGTPIQNYISDLTSLLKFTGVRDIEDLDTLVEKHVLRRTKDQVKIKFPKITEVNSFLDITSKKERKMYNYVDNDMIMDCNMHPLEKQLRLRQFAIMPQLTINGIAKKKKKLMIWSHSNTKMMAVINNVVKNHSTEKPIIFTHFKKEIEFLKRRLLDKKIKVRIIDGSVPMDQRKTIIDSHENYDALLIQIQAGSTGLNLQMFDTVYFTSPHWNPTHEQQAIARVHRIGQTKAVTVRRFILNNTIESYILKVQERKHQLVDDILG